MPCSDVTELLYLELDAQDCLRSYRLIKKTCGRAVGEESLLHEEVHGAVADELLERNGDTFAEDSAARVSEEELVLRLKHFFALQGGLRVLLGRESGGAADPVKVARVACDDGATILEAVLSVDVLTDQIRACGRCKGCGSLARKLEQVE